MSTNLAARLKRIEERLEAVAPAPDQLGIADRMRALREARLERARRGEPEPQRMFEIRTVDPLSSRESQAYARHTNLAGIRRLVSGDAGYEHFAQLLTIPDYGSYAAAYRQLLADHAKEAARWSAPKQVQP